MRAFTRWKNRGFTLIELMIVVAIIGVLAALAIYGVRRYLLNAKTAEAKSAIGRIAKDAVSAYERGSTSSALIDPGKAGGAGAHTLCDAKTEKPVPNSIEDIEGKKYQSQSSDWTGPWTCLKFSMNEPQYYRYNYKTPAGLSGEGAAFSAIANGDLDGNKVTSEFIIQGEVMSGVVRVSPNIGETNPEE